jgi:ATP-dependent Zn protease
MIERIDAAILRRGRFDHIVEVGMPSKIEVESLFNALLSKVPTAYGLILDPILDDLTGRALSDSAFVVREAARLAAKSGKNQIDQGSIEAALQSLPEVKENTPRRIGFITE